MKESICWGLQWLGLLLLRQWLMLPRKLMQIVACGCTEKGNDQVSEDWHRRRCSCLHQRIRRVAHIRLLAELNEIGGKHGRRLPRLMTGKSITRLTPRGGHQALVSRPGSGRCWRRVSESFFV
ncbi:uncharacterized protein LOC100192823 precursor [Zea mays]|uniref:Secreted protein n=1 Tax=Zea mays TaxID=4577 RepID=B4FCS3_MAIZE|nr:uncharacterized protein LOC100192823 precursor [Zea mays]ACF79916.1 unknown [Zea mays]|eukprot:NP_001131486.1 uncharacterized protein LOC100192823 precursor [Zea mays]